MMSVNRVTLRSRVRKSGAATRFAMILDRSGHLSPTRYSTSYLATSSWARS